MADDQHREQPSVDEVLAKIDESPIGEMLRDEQAMERMVFDLGNITMRGLADIPAYWSVMEAGFNRVGELDLASMSEQLDELIAEQQEPEARQGEGQGDEEADELWQGFGRRDDR